MNRSRRGYTLIECLIVFVLVGATLTTITSALYSLRRSDVGVRDQVSRESTIQRLAQQLRRDAHDAVSSRLIESDQPSKAASQLVLSMNDQRAIEYTIAPDQIVRIVRQGDATIHQEIYPVIKANSGRWAIETGGERPLITLWLPFFAGPLARADLLSIQAAVGLDTK